MVRPSGVACALVLAATTVAAQTFDDDLEGFLAALDGSATTEGFDGLPHRTVVTDQLTGMTFVPVLHCPPATGAIVLDAEVFPFYGLPVSRPNVLVNCDEAIGSPMEIELDCSVEGVGLTSVTPNNIVTLELFDPEGATVFSAPMSDVGRRFLGHVADGPVVRARVSGLPLAVAQFVIDDLIFGVTADGIELRIGDPVADQVPLAWSGGSGPFAVQSRSDCRSAWTTRVTTAGRETVLPAGPGPLVQYRVVEAAGDEIPRHVDFF